MARYDAVLFDLFSGLLDSQPAYDETAGSASLGSRWRREHSRLCYAAGDYRPHDDVVAVTGEAAGAYKPRPESYRLALEALGTDAAHPLFVAGSPDDIGGADRVRMPVYWHNRRALDLGDRTRPLVEHDSLVPLLDD